MYIHLYSQYHTSNLNITTPVAESDSIVKEGGGGGGGGVGWGGRTVGVVGGKVKMLETEEEKKKIGSGVRTSREGRSLPLDPPLYFLRVSNFYLTPMGCCTFSEFNGRKTLPLSKSVVFLHSLYKGISLGMVWGRGRGLGVL